MSKPTRSKHGSRQPKAQNRPLAGDYEVGKGKPPLETRWKPGVCPNPKGRPKGSKNRKTIVKEAERRTVPITTGDRRRKANHTEIGLHVLQKMIRGGNWKAFLEYLKILERHDDGDDRLNTSDELSAEDQKILDDLIERKSRSKITPNGD